MATATTMSHAPQQQPFLRELIERQNSRTSPRTSLPEETPQMNFMQMVTLTRAEESSSFTQEDLKSSTADVVAPLKDTRHLPMKREESGDSQSLKSDGSTAELSSMEGDSSISSMFSTTKLYGRQEEEEILAQAFDRISRRKAPRKLEFMLISGPCGTGKTRLGESLRSQVSNAGGFFCSGKFDQHQDDPFAPLCSAFNDYVRQLLQADEETIRTARQRIRASVEGDLCALAKMIPPLGILMKDDQENSESKTIECTPCNQKHQKQGRSIFALHKLMRAICTPEQPIVMMLDDIQWATRCPLEKLRVMISDDMNEGLMLVGCCRNDVDSTSELSGFLRSLEKERVEITNVSIRNLQKEHIEEMVNEAFLMSEDQSASLAKFVFDHSQGNAYFVVESLKMLHQESRVLKYNSKSKTWSVNHDICDQMMSYCPQDFMERKLRTAPRDIQKVFMAAACLGANITERLLEVALQESVGERFQKLVEKGKFTYNESRGAYAFKHNTFQTACYDLISEELRPAFHLEVGLRLWEHLSEDELDNNLFLVLNQLKQGATLMQDQATRYEIAAFCIRAAEKAAAIYAFPTASDYLRFAFILLGTDHWEKAYDLSVVLYNYAAEVEFARGDSDRVDFLIDEVLSHATKCPEKLRAYSTRIYVLSVRGQMERAIEIGIRCLNMLGVSIKPQCHQVNLVWAMARVSRKLRGKSDPMIKRLPHMTDFKKMAAMQILNMLFLSTYTARKDLFPFVVLKMVKLTLVDGISAISSVAFAGYGALLCFAGQIEEGLRYGKLALDLVEEWGAQSFQSRVGAFVWGQIFVHVRPFTESLGQLKEGHRLGLQTGDTEFAMLNAFLHTMFMIDLGMFTTSTMIDQIVEFKEVTALHDHSSQLEALNSLLASIKVFADPKGSLTDHSGALNDGLEAAKKNHNGMALELIYSAKLFFNCAARDFSSSLEIIERRDAVLAREGSIHAAFGLYLDALTYFAEARRRKNPQERRQLLKRARSCMRVLKNLAKINPSIALGKFVLLEAEDAATMNKNNLAEEKYKHAAALATKYGSYFEVAFANQAAGEHCINDLKDSQKAIEHFEEACIAYEKLEGRAAVTNLKKRIAQIKV